jgi:hypothetical protein
MPLRSFRSAPAQKTLSSALAITSARTPPRDPSPARERVVISWLRVERRERERAFELWGLERVRRRMWPRWGAGMSWVVRRGGVGGVEKWRGDGRWGEERWRWG